MWKHFVYRHKKADTGQVFYIGKGTARKQFFERAFTSDRRNKWWQRVVAKHGFTVEIIASCLTDAEAQKVERAFIAEYGRRRLCNLTDGGDGSCNPFISLATRQKRSLLAQRPRTQAWLDSIRIARKNGGNGGVVKKGDRLPQPWRENITASKLGSRNPMFGRCGSQHPNSRRVIDRLTGRTFDSVLMASEHHGVKMKTLYNWLSGHRLNPTSLEFV